MARKISVPSVEPLTTKMLHCGEVLRQLFDQLQRLVGIGIQCHHADVGMRLRNDIGEEFVARAFGFQPDHVEAQQNRFQRFAGIIARIDYGQPQDVRHGCRFVDVWSPQTKIQNTKCKVQNKRTAVGDRSRPVHHRILLFAFCRLPF